jgi:hypothetical protein
MRPQVAILLLDDGKLPLRLPFEEHVGSSAEGWVLKQIGEIGSPLVRCILDVVEGLPPRQRTGPMDTSLPWAPARRGQVVTESLRPRGCRSPRASLRALGGARLGLLYAGVVAPVRSR